MLREEISKIVSGALPQCTTVDDIVAHLISDNVGVASVDDLKEVTAENLLELNLAPIPKKKLLKAFQSCGKVSETDESHSGLNDMGPGGSGQADQQRPGCSGQGDQQRRSSTEDHRRSLNNLLSEKYAFTLRWSSMPQATLDKLEAKEILKERADPEDEAELRLALVKKVKSDYAAFKERHPGSQKHPGVKIYKSVTDQVFAKFEYCFKDIINGQEVGDGKASFQKHFKISIENQLRDKTQQTARQRAVRARGTVGVLQAEYEPHVPNSIEQEGIRNHLQNMDKLNPSSWDPEEILKDMIVTYELQREDIVKVKEKVFSTAEKQSDQDEPPTKALSEIQVLWPFLFKHYVLSQHHKRLTGREVLPHVKEFMTSKLDYYMMYLTSASTSNVKNLAVRLKAEAYLEVTAHAPKKLLCFMLMIINHFKENKDLLLLPIERTTQLNEIEIPTNEACIVALDENIFEAEKFFICVDGVGLMEVNDFAEALVALIEIIFIFDVQYPKLPLTFEFIERCMCKMAISDTRVKDKRGKELLVITAAVRDTVNGEEKFEEEIRKMDS